MRQLNQIYLIQQLRKFSQINTMEKKIQNQLEKLSLAENQNQNFKTKKSNIQIVYNQLNLLHKSSKPHPQKPERVSQILQHLRQTKYKANLIEYQKLRQKIVIQEATMDKITKQQILKIYGQNFHDFVEGMWPQGIKKTEMFINIDTYFMKDTYRAAFQAVKTGLAAVQSSINKKDQINLCLVRPPGHHSGMKSQPHGFCFFNNVAIAADYCLKKTDKKVAILDWDIHHGEGTQKIFYERSDILYISIHRFDNAQFFPHVKESGPEYVGAKQGEGFNINICWNLPKVQKNKIRQKQMTCGDNQYLYVFKHIILPILTQFNPDSIFISSGFDCANGDPIGDTKVSQTGFKIMSNLIKKLNKRIFLFLQGGYNIQVLKHSVQAVVDGLTSDNKEGQSQQIALEQINQFAKQDILKVIQIQKKYWNLIGQDQLK